MATPYKEARDRLQEAVDRSDIDKLKGDDSVLI